MLYTCISSLGTCRIVCIPLAYVTQQNCIYFCIVTWVQSAYLRYNIAQVIYQCCEIKLFNYCLLGFKESDNLWWDAFATEFFEDDAVLTLSFSMEDGPKRYSKLDRFFAVSKLFNYVSSGIWILLTLFFLARKKIVVLYVWVALCLCVASVNGEYFYVD